MQGSREEFLTESHKIKQKVGKKWFEALAVFLIGLFFYAMFGYLLREWLISPEDRAFLKKINEYRVQSSDPTYLKRLEEAERAIKRKYPIVFTPVQVPALLRSPASVSYKVIATLYALSPFFFAIGLFLYFRIVYEKAKKEVFYQVPQEEIELYRKDPDYPYFTDTKLVDWNTLVDVKKVLELYAYVGNLTSEEYQQLQDAVHLARDVFTYYANHVQPESAKNPKFLALAYFALWHYALCLYGNVPTGYLSRFIKDEDLKVVMTLYQRRRINVGKDHQLARKVLQTLAYCHRDNGLYHVFDLIDPLKA